MSGFKAAALFDTIKQSIENAPEAEKKANMKKVNGVFQFDIKNAQGETGTWVIDLKQKGTVTKGAPTSGKPDIVIMTSDDTFVELATGKLAGQRAFMAGKLKVRGNMMLATRLDTVFKSMGPKVTAAAGGGGATAAGGASPNQSSKAKRSATVAPASSSSSSSSSSSLASSAIFKQIGARLESMPINEREALVKKSKAVYQFNVKDEANQVHTFVLDLKNGGGKVTMSDATGASGSNVKPDITITIADQDFVGLSSGKLNGQKAFMSGKLRIQGQMLLATKLDSILKSMQAGSKL